VSLLIHSIFSALPVLPLLVFLAEMCVVTLGTIRIIFVARGMKILAPVLGFFEVIIWLFAIGQIMQNLSNIGCYVAFAAGFTAGNYFGVLIEKKLAIGTVVVRTITHRNPRILIESLQAAGFGVTSMDAEGGTGPVKIVFTVVRRKELERVVTIIKQFDAKAFHSVDELQAAAEGIFPATKGQLNGIAPACAWLVRSATNSLKRGGEAIGDCRPSREVLARESR
jgi:uncharacterized protein YebE (UPF0316 family)